MKPHINTLFEFISIPYENQHQTLNIKKIYRGKIKFREYYITLLQPERNSTKLDRHQDLNIFYRVHAFCVRLVNKNVRLGPFVIWQIVLRYTICGPLGPLLSNSGSSMVSTCMLSRNKEVSLNNIYSFVKSVHKILLVTIKKYICYEQCIACTHGIPNYLLIDSVFKLHINVFPMKVLVLSFTNFGASP